MSKSRAITKKEKWTLKKKWVVFSLITITLLAIIDRALVYTADKLLMESDAGF
jgi:hypothetical protein